MSGNREIAEYLIADDITNMQMALRQSLVLREAYGEEKNEGQIEELQEQIGLMVVEIMDLDDSVEIPELEISDADRIAIARQELEKIKNTITVLNARHVVAENMAERKGPNKDAHRQRALTVQQDLESYQTQLQSVAAYLENLLPTQEDSSPTDTPVSTNGAGSNRAEIEGTPVQKMV